MDRDEGIKPPPNLPTEDLSIQLDLERREPPTSEVVEQMRFGLSRIGPLTEAVLNNNGYALAAALPVGVLTAPTRCLSTDRPTNAEIGEMIYEIDTTGMYVWDGSSWVSVGTPGAAAEIYVGSTTTGVSGSNASVVNVGTATSAVLDFTIPRGDTGATGATGPAGAAATITVGATTTGVSGSSASVSNVGSTSAAIFDFTIPRGDTGATGTAATISAGTTTTLTPGSSATVVNSGTSSAAVFDFGIPAGSAATVAVSTTTTLAPGSPATVSNVGTSSAAVLEFGIPQGAAGVGVPTGCIIPFGGASLPSADWLWCDGSLVSQSTYSTLYAVLGANRYGTDTGTDFYLPDLRERFPRGVSSVTAGVTTTNTNTHTHTLNAFNASFTGNAVNTDSQGAHSHSTNGASTSSGGEHNHNNHGANTGGPSNIVNRAAGNNAAAHWTHTHGVNGSSTSSTGGHNHNVNGANTSNTGAHTHSVTASGNVSITAGTADNATHVPAYVEVNYIIKT